MNRPRVREALRGLDRQPTLVATVRRARQLLPGDAGFGDRLSTAGDDQLAFAGRHLVELTGEAPGVLREAGLGALQVWQALLESAGRGRGNRPVTILFTDLVAFSGWALRVGDDAALRLLREVGEALEPPVTRRRGQVVKRLGDGMMAVFDEPVDALEAVLDGRDRLAGVEVAGYRPRLRAGLHAGRPRLLGGDYLGVDVNIAARVAGMAAPDEVVVTAPVLAALDPERFAARRKRSLFRAKGVPGELHIFAVRSRG